jgi:hypothetical protein
MLIGTVLETTHWSCYRQLERRTPVLVDEPAPHQNERTTFRIFALQFQKDSMAYGTASGLSKDGSNPGSHHLEIVEDVLSTIDVFTRHGADLFFCIEFADVI